MNDGRLTAGQVACIVSSGRRKKSKYEFEVGSVCNVLRMSAQDLVAAMRQLKSNGEIQYETIERGLLARVRARERARAQPSVNRAT